MLWQKPKSDLGLRQNLPYGIKPISETFPVEPPISAPL